MKKLNLLREHKLAEKFAVPRIIPLLKPLTDTKLLLDGFRNDRDLDDFLQLKENKSLSDDISLILNGIPMADKVFSRALDQEWIEWFLDTQVSKYYPQAYAQIQFTPDLREWVIKKFKVWLTKAIRDAKSSSDSSMFLL